MKCPLCQSRAARRHCPALAREICAVCCGTKRRVEIRCPETCAYLGNAAAHPPAVVRRQQERDVALLLPALERLSEAQRQLFFLTLTLVDRFRGEGLDAAVDADVADAAEALAGTYETAARGLIYDQRASSLPAQRLAAEIRKVYDDLGRARPSGFAEDAARVLRALAERIGAAHKSGEDGRRGFLDLAARVAAQIRRPEASEAPPSSIIVP
jgi:hypothetical protein